MNLTVEFIVLASGALARREFSSYYLCRKFVNKLRRYKKCRLVSYPYFGE